MIDVYECLVQAILESVYVTEEQARDVVKFLQNEDLIDYDLLKEVYLYPDADDEE